MTNRKTNSHANDGANKHANETAKSDNHRRNIDREDIMQAALSLLGPHRSISTLSLREVARAAGIAPNSFYRHFRDTDELAVAIINQAGASLRQIIGEARSQIGNSDHVAQTSVEIFMQQLDADSQWLPLLLREGSVGSNEFKQAVEQQLQYFEAELQADLIKLTALHNRELYDVNSAARAITRLVFAMGALASDLPSSERNGIIQQTTTMVRMILRGALQ